MNAAAILRLIGTVLATTATSLAPTFGKDWWYAILVGIAGAFALAAPSILPPSIQNAIPPKG